MPKTYKANEVRLYIGGKEILPIEGDIRIVQKREDLGPGTGMDYSAVAFPKPAKRKKTSARSRRADKSLLEEVRSQPCVACLPGAQVKPTDPDHITSVGAGGGDDPSNIWPLCRGHHIQRHAHGLFYMATKYVGCERWLKEHGRFDEILRKGRK